MVIPCKLWIAGICMHDCPVAYFLVRILSGPVFLFLQFFLKCFNVDFKTLLSSH